MRFELEAVLQARRREEEGLQAALSALQAESEARYQSLERARRRFEIAFADRNYAALSAIEAQLKGFLLAAEALEPALLSAREDLFRARRRRRAIDLLKERYAAAERRRLARSEERERDELNRSR